MCVCKYNLLKVGKIYKDSKLYLQHIKSLIKTDDIEIKSILYYSNIIVMSKRK